MSFSISFFARDTNAAQAKLREAYAPAAVKAIVELAIAGIPLESTTAPAGASHQSVATLAPASDSTKGVNRATPTPKRLCGILVETHGHIDEHGGRSSIGLFRVDPFYD